MNIGNVELHTKGKTDAWFPYGMEYMLESYHRAKYFLTSNINIHNFVHSFVKGSLYFL